MVAVPWPSELEKMVTGTLMPFNASISKECLLWGNVAAVRQGKLIALSNGTLGVEEACSGIRSLQATIMMAWFFGELHFLRLRQRLIILVVGLFSALLTNIIRTVALSLIAAKGGMAAASSKHDAAALTALAANVLIMLLVTKKVAGKTSTAPRQPTSPSTALPSFRSGWGIFAAACLLAWPVVEIWYRRGETPISGAWHIATPQAAQGYRPHPIADRTKIMLRYSDGWSARWQSPEGKPMQGYYFDWSKGKVPPENMNVHTPGGCLTAAGFKVVGEAAPLKFRTNGQEREARVMRLLDGERPLFVLFSVSSKAELENAKTYGFDFSYAKRWLAAFHGLRNAGQRLLEVGLWDVSDEATARMLFTQFLEAQVREGDL
jgi:exosortase/archaeosortase family protein